MRGYSLPTYGEKIARIYDDWYSMRMDHGPAVSLLAELARGGRALELGVGTGRIAIPLAARGIHVAGIEASEAMIKELRAKPGGAQIEVTKGDFADVAINGRFSLIYASFATFFALPSQGEQLRCLRNVTSHLSEGGVFAMDAFVPDPGRYQQNQRLAVQDVSSEHILLEASQHDAVNQRIDTVHVAITENGIRLFPVVLRYAWPTELDAMALASGLALSARYNGYDRRPFTAASFSHVSIYQLSEGRL